MSDESDAPYEAILRAVGDSSLTATVLLRTQQARTERLFQLCTATPDFLAGIDTIIVLFTGLAEVTVSPAFRSLLERAAAESIRAIEGLLADDQQTVNDTARVMMEIEVLLQEWTVDLDRMTKWQDMEEERRHQVFGFGKVLQRLKQRQGVDDQLVMPERQEYHVHSMTLHPTHEPSDFLPPDPVWMTSEVLIHMERVKNAAIALVLVDDKRVGVDPDSPPRGWRPDVWGRLCGHYVGLRDQALNEILAEKGMVMTPRVPIPKGQSRIVPADQAEDTDGAADHSYEGE
ncbi:hypothetical protein GZ998_05575 [Actinomyces sp. 594]|uniref:hypothetical protein n=1 Tax=Actinomyces sp. 594 TaxID=2057793 RepID=UPI001C56BB06|nr:hypothetical protein [Actinomyces sp. 594]MBW3068983.1 hypothetical protein [Actinomyces sp. 594]